MSKIGWADKEWWSTNHKYIKHRPSSRLTKGIAKHFLVFEMSLGSNFEVLILTKFKIQISHHYQSIFVIFLLFYDFFFRFENCPDFRFHLEFDLRYLSNLLIRYRK